MFRKLFKYEWTAMMRSLFPVYGAVLAVTVLNALMFHVIVPEAGRTELLDSPFLELIPWFTGALYACCLLYTSPSPRDLSTSRMPSSA